MLSGERRCSISLKASNRPMPSGMARMARMGSTAGAKAISCWGDLVSPTNNRKARSKKDGVSSWGGSTGSPTGRFTGERMALSFFPTDDDVSAS